MLLDFITAGYAIEIDICGLDDALLTIGGLDKLLGEAAKSQNCFIYFFIWLYLPESGISHRQCGRSSTILGLDNFITTKLDAYVSLAV